MYILVTLGLVIWALVGAFISRMCGGMKPKLPWGLDQWIYALPYGLLPGAALWALNPYVAVGLGLLSYAGAFLGKRTGHGGGLDLGTWTKPRSDERLEFLIKPLHGKIPEYWYDALLLAVTGVAVSLVASAAIAVVSPLAALPTLIGGLLKPLPYMLGWKTHPTGETPSKIHELDEATEIGEAGTGLLGYLGLGLSAIMLLA